MNTKKYFPIDNKLFTGNRSRLAKKLKSNSIAVFNSNDIMPTNADGTMAFQQNADLFYLSGIDQEETILVLYPDAVNPDDREMLFLRETNPHIAVWEGHKFTKEEAAETSGIKSVYWAKDFNAVFNKLMADAERVYLNTNEHKRAIIEVETRDARFGKWCREKYPMHKYERVAPVMHHLRAIKSKQEIELIREACNITGKGFRRLLGFVKPGVWEYEVEAELLHEFIRNRSTGFAYGPIIGSGAGSCVLHYTQNNKQCKSGDILILDVAAEYANYKSDLTRVLPINGKFTKRQKAVYNAILRVFRASSQMLKVGNTIANWNKETGKLIEEELIKLKLLRLSEVRKQDPKAPLYKKYFMHGTGHYIGLDVHDIGDLNAKFEEGMVFTCEPGIYINREKLGVRLENDILITKKGPVDLMADIPIEADEIEELMNS